MVPRLAVLISGGGTTLQNFIDRIADGSLPARVAVVISSRRDAYGLERARAAGIPTAVVARKEFAGEDEFNDALHHELDQHTFDLIVLTDRHAHTDADANTNRYSDSHADSITNRDADTDGHAPRQRRPTPRRRRQPTRQQ